MVQPGTPEWDELVKGGWVLSEVELRQLTEDAGAQGGEPATKRGGVSSGVDSTMDGYEYPARFTDAEARSDELRVVEQERRELGLPPTINRRGKKVVAPVNISEEARDGFRAIAASFGWLHGGEGNMSALVEAIGRGVLIVRRPGEGEGEGS